MRTYGSMGALYAVPNATNPTPVPFASLKGVTVDFKQAKKKFNGQYRVAIDAIDTELDITVKIKTADFRASALNLVIPALTTTTGSPQIAQGEQFTIPTTPYQATVSQSASFREDAGVLDMTTGKWLTRVASAPITQQYSVAAGVYTFAAADVGHIVNIAYAWTSATTGVSGTLANAFKGPSTPFKLRVYTPGTVNGAVRNVGFELLSVHFENLSLAGKIDDFSEVDLSGFATTDMIGFTGNVMVPLAGE